MLFAPKNNMAAEGSARAEIAEMVRECVRNEIALQRSGNNSSLLMRTRDLIANSARSASREVTNAIEPSHSTAAVNSLCHGVSSSSSAGQNSKGTTESYLLNRQSCSFQTGSKRTASATNQHPWRFKKSKQKSQKQEFHPKAIHLLDKADEDNGLVPDYTVTEEMILLKGYFELGTGQSEGEIRESITEVLKQRFPFVRPDHFDFVKRERNKVTTPVVSKSLEWNYKHVKELCGQGKLYVRLNVPRECIDHELSCELSATEDEELMKSPFLNANESERASVTAAPECGSSHNSFSNTDDVIVMGAYNSSSVITNTASSSSSQSDIATLRELVPSASEEEIGNALLQCGGLDSAANSLLMERSGATCESLVQIIDVLGQKLTGKRKKLDVDEDELIHDAVAFYKSTSFDPCSPLRIAYQGQPAIDGGGVLRQFYTDLFQGIIEGKLMLLFEGENNRKLPSYQPQAVMCGMIEMVGKMISHSLVQGGPGFPCLALPCFYYLVTGDVMCAFAYCDVWDVPDPCSRNVILQLIDGKTDEELKNLANDEEVINLISQCGETSVLRMSTKSKVVQSCVMYEVISKRKMALDQLRKGLTTLGLLDEISRYPHLFEGVFTFKAQELTPAIVNDCLKYPKELSEQDHSVKLMMTRFIDQSPSSRLMQFMQYCTGSKTMPSLHSFAISVSFHSESYISSSTCTFTLLIPNSFTSYGLFEAAMNSTISLAGKSFTTV